MVEEVAAVVTLNGEPRKTGRPPFAWSFSRVQNFKKCPKKYEISVINKQKEPENPQMMRGKDIHDQSARFVTGNADTLAPALSRFESRLKDAKARGAVAEEKWAFDQNWEPVADYFGPDVWLRANTDLYWFTDKVLNVVDIKTGRQYPEEHRKQLRLYGLAAILKFSLGPTDRVIVADWYTDQPGQLIDKMEFNGSARTHLIREWEQEIKPLADAYATRTFTPKPGNQCRWCAFAKDVGGQCDFTTRGLKAA